MRICASCGEENSDRARFCQVCAAPLGEQPVATAERKLVTVLFADVTGSTGLGERLDPERLSEVMRAYFDAMRGEIEAEGGTVEKFIGDAVVAAFGVPAAHDDDPARALRAALRMRARLAELNRALSERYGLALEMRTGVNTGEAITMTAPVAGEPMATGDVVNVAARLEQMCEPGGILVAERTVRAVRGFRFEDANRLVLRGRDQSLDARLLAGLDEERSPGLPGMRVPMVGRDHELGILTSLYSRLDVERRPHLVTVYGDAGVGKSRLISEFAAWAQALDRPADMVHGRCLSYGEGVAYWPLAEILKERAEVLDTDTSEVALRRVRELGAQLLTPDVAADPSRSIAALGHTVGLADPDVDLGGLPARQVRLEIHAAWRSFFSALARTDPVLVVVEDIHWADAAMLDLLEELAGRVRGPVMLICSSRPELTARRPGWGGGRRDVSSVLLEPLSGADADRLVHQLLEVNDIPDAVQRRILDRAEGNPFFLEEIIRRLLDEGMITRRDERWQAASAITDVTIPDTIQGVLAARVDLLDPPHKRTLQMAATVGRVFWTDPLRRLLGEATGDVDEILQLLEERELVVEQLGSAMAGQREYTFKHGLTRDVAYESLPHRDRARAHQVVADWLEETTGERRGEFYELLGFHYEQAHRYALESDRATAEPLRRRALEYLMLAARQANARLAVSAAQRLGERALELAVGGRERATAFAVLGEVAANDFRGDDVWHCYTRAADAMLVDAPGEHDTIAQLCGRAVELPVRNGGLMVHTVVSDSDIRRYMDLGFANAGERDSEALARLLTSRCALPFRYAALVGREAIGSVVDGERAAAIAERLNRPDLLSAALDSINTQQLELGHFGEMERTVARRAALLPTITDPWEIADAYNMMAWAATFLGKYREALDVVDAAMRMSAATTEARWAAQLVIPWSAIARMRLGDFAGCLEDFAEGVRMLGDRAANPPPFFTRHYGCAAYVHELRGDSDAADRILGPLQLSLAPDTPEVVLSWARSWQALILAHRDRAEEARAVLEQVRGWRQWRAFALEALCEVVAAQQRWDEAADVCADARSAAAEGESRIMPCYADRLEGRAATAGGDHATAVAALTRAAHGFEEIGARWELACTAVHLAEALARQDQRDAARNHLLSAETIFAELRSVRELEDARAALASL